MTDKPKIFVRESLVLQACLGWLYHKGCFTWRNNSGVLRDKKNNPIRFGLNGSADIIGMTPNGRFLAVECKSERGQLSEPQERFRDRVLASGGIYIVARSTDDLERELLPLL